MSFPLGNTLTHTPNFTPSYSPHSQLTAHSLQFRSLICQLHHHDFSFFKLRGSAETNPDPIQPELVAA